LGVSSFINSLPKGLKTVIDSDGNGLSSGQRQIIALARILLRDPKILILDEATARIDTKSEKLLQVAIEKAVKNKTTFVIAHRLSTIQKADQILVIEEGNIVAFSYKLAQQGYLVICPMCFLWVNKGDRSIELQTQIFQERHPGSKGMAKMLFDASRAVDILENKGSY